jgi:hypothetical protein
MVIQTINPMKLNLREGLYFQSLPKTAILKIFRKFSFLFTFSIV